jgi:MoaA/NifB/PqqE/SkfB family radical SAM enzyme
MEAFKLFQLSIAYSQSLLAFTIDGPPRTFSASFAVSNRCNIHCSYCNFPNMSLSELSLDQIEVVFSKLKKMGVKRLGLLGGEPLLRKDILQIIALARKFDFFISLNTNLLLYDKYKDKLGEVDYFYTSLDGTPEKHIANRGAQNYEKIIAAIRDIVRKGKKVVGICVVTEPDFISADYLINLAETEKFSIHFQPECYTDDPGNNSEVARKSPSSQMKSDDIRDFWLYLLRRKRGGASISSSSLYLKYITEWKNYSVSSYFDEKQKCGAGRSFLFVDAQGYAFPCAYTKGKTPGVNLLTDDWHEKFNKKTPCTTCVVGPMLEFNLLFQKPVVSVLNALRNI